MAIKAKVQTKIDLRKLKIVMDNAISRYSNLSSIAEFLRNRIFQFTKRGLMIGKIRQRGGPPTKPLKLKPLSPLYIEYRKDLLKGETKRLKVSKTGAKAAKKQALKKFGEFFSPARSNLTFSGQMLDALITDVSTKDSTVTVEVDNTTRDDDSGLTNKQLAVKVAEEGRPFLGLDLVGRDRIRRMVIAELRKALKRR